MINVLTYGTFDLLHPGHINLLRRAKNLGDYLVVGVSTDLMNKYKKKVAVQDFYSRSLNVGSLRYVDYLIAEETFGQKTRDIIEHNIDILVMGDDWEGRFDKYRRFCEVVYLPRTPDYSTTDLIKKIKNGEQYAR